jgi:hypothetical protein
MSGLPDTPRYWTFLGTFVSEVLLRSSEIELVDQEKFASAALLKLSSLYNMK